jgi:hypothetical protein
MSATKPTTRGGEGRDFFPTPWWCTHRLLDALATKLPIRSGALWLEPCAGDGAIVDACASWCWEHMAPSMKWERPFDWMTCDIEAPPLWLPNFHRGSYFDLRVPKKRDVALTNVPFSLAVPFIEKMRRDAHVAISLLRINFLASAERAPWWKKNPADIYVLPNRPRFSTGKNADSCEYAWFVWGLTKGGHHHVLDVTPDAERGVRLRKKAA